MATTESRQVRAAKNQSLFRAINERIKELNVVFDVFEPVGQWVCECADDGCIELLSMTLGEYDEIRAHPARFPVLPGHVLEEVEFVVDENDRYVVVEKIGAGREVAERHAPGRSAAA